MLFTGDGKGKTTAAAGQALRYIGAGVNVAFVQFLKDGSSSEVAELRRLGVLVVADRARPLPIEEGDALEREELELLHEGLARARAFGAGAVVLDELAYVAARVSREGAARIERELEAALAWADLVVTGRGAPGWLAARADLVTEMRAVKHYFDRGTQASRGREE